RVTANHLCTGSKEWSGNFMNWAATQTIDPFRSVLTGGYRVRDTASETWLEKARHDGQGGAGIYPDRSLSGSTVVQGAVVSNSWSSYKVRIQGLGNKMRFTRTGDLYVGAGDVTAYNPASSGPYNSTVYEVSVRVKVCVPNLLEANCRQYSGGYKPEGLIQQYAEQLRIGIFGFLNDHNMLRDGGVLRARQKFVGPTMIEPGGGEVGAEER